MIIIKKYNLILKFSAINVVSVDLIRFQSYYVLKKQLDMLIMFHSCVLIVMQFTQSAWHSPLSSTRFCQSSWALPAFIIQVVVHHCMDQGTCGHHRMHNYLDCQVV